MVIAESTFTVKGVVMVVLPAQKQAASPETQVPGVAVWALVVLHWALTVSHVPA
jgi:hypothetical protein